MVLTEEDFSSEQQYFRSKLQLHNRCFHGCRVVCGLDVEMQRNAILIDPGMAIDCEGREIIVPESTEMPLPARKRSFYLTLSYFEFGTRPTPTYSPGSRENSEFSRVQESFRFGWKSKDPQAGHAWRDGAWSACGRHHPVAIAKFLVREGRLVPDGVFNEKIDAGRQNR
jgi:hypothetical protein